MTMAEQYEASLQQEAQPKQMSMAEQYAASQGGGEISFMQPSEDKKPDVSSYFTGDMSDQEKNYIAEKAYKNEIVLPDGVRATTVTNYDENGLPVPGYELKQDETIGDKLYGAGEALLTTVTGATSGAVGYLGGIAKGLYDTVSDGEYGTKAGAENVKETAEGMAADLTFAPKTESGARYTKNVAKAFEPIMALGPEAAMMRTPGIADMKTGTNMLRQDAPGLKRIAEIIRKDPTNVEAARFRLVGGKKVNGAETPPGMGFNQIQEGGIIIKDQAAVESIKQGFKEGVVASVKASSKQDRTMMQKMLNILKTGRKNERYAAENRPSDVIGQSLDKRVKFMMNVKKQAGKEIEAVAKGLEGQTVNYEPAVTKFMSELEGIGVKTSVNEKGKLIIKTIGSDIEGDKASKVLLQRVFNRLMNTDKPDAYGVHRAKQFLDTQVSYGASKANPLSKKTEYIVKGLRKSLNDTLADSFEGYRTANTKYSDAIGMLDDMQTAVGKRIDFDSPNASKAFGTSSRKILSNYSTRVEMLDTFNKLEATAKKYGFKADADIVSQVMFANELDRMFGSSAPTSLKGQIEQGIKKGVDVVNGGLFDTAVNIGAKGVEKVRGINEENAIKAMEAILQRK